MAKRKVTSAAIALRQSITAQMKQGPQTVVELAAAVGCDPEKVRAVMCNLTKNGYARALRETGPDGLIVRYKLVDEADKARTGATPTRPVLKQWPACQVVDPFHLPEKFFGPRAAA